MLLVIVSLWLLDDMLVEDSSAIGVRTLCPVEEQELVDIVIRNNVEQVVPPLIEG